MVKNNIGKYTRIESLDECFSLNKFPEHKKHHELSTLELINKNNISVYFKAIAEFFKFINIEKCSVLGIGCGIGNYRKYFHVSRMDIDYYGCDVDPKSVNAARQYFKDGKIIVGDAYGLPYPRLSFDVAIIEGTLTYLKDYNKCITEACRVARRFVIFDKIAVIEDGETSFFHRNTDDIDGVLPEVHFGEAHFLHIMKKHGLKLIAAAKFESRRPVDGIESCSKSYLAIKEECNLYKSLVS